MRVWQEVMEVRKVRWRGSGTVGGKGSHPTMVTVEIVKRLGDRTDVVTQNLARSRIEPGSPHQYWVPYH
jgi:hypothetical protein